MRGNEFFQNFTCRWGYLYFVANDYWSWMTSLVLEDEIRRTTMLEF